MFKSRIHISFWKNKTPEIVPDIYICYEIMKYSLFNTEGFYHHT